MSHLHGSQEDHQHPGGGPTNENPYSPAPHAVKTVGSGHAQRRSASQNCFSVTPADMMPVEESPPLTMLPGDRCGDSSCDSKWD